MVAGVIRGQEVPSACRIGHDLVEIDDGVDMPWFADPRIHPLTIFFAGGGWMVVIGSEVRHDGRDVDLDAVRVGSRYDLR